MAERRGPLRQCVQREVVAVPAPVLPPQRDQHIGEEEEEEERDHGGDDERLSGLRSC